MRRQAHLAHLIEEQDPSRCQLDVSSLRLLRARECAAFVPKQLGLEQLFGKCRAVDGNERAVFPRRRLVNEPRDDFLAGARLALQKDRGLRRCDSLRRREDTLPCWRRSDRARVGAIAPHIK